MAWWQTGIAAVYSSEHLLLRWQDRFGAVAMDEAHLAAAVRTVSLDPVRARLVDAAQDWRWSGVAAHLATEEDALVRLAPVLERYGPFADFLGQEGDDETAWRALRMSETSGRPLGSDDWLDRVEAKTGRTVKPQKRGPKGEGNQVYFVNWHRNRKQISKLSHADSVIPAC